MSHRAINKEIWIDARTSYDQWGFKHNAACINLYQATTLAGLPWPWAYRLPK